MKPSILSALLIGAGISASAPALAEPLTEATAAALLTEDRPERDAALDEDRMPAKALAFMQIEPGERVLDVFAGEGYYTDLLARAVGPDGFVIAQNPAAFGKSEQIQQAVRMRGYAGTRLPNAAAYYADFDNVALAPSSLDTVLFHLVYHDLYFESDEYGIPYSHPQQLLAEVHAGLKPGGTVTVIDHVGAGSDPRAEADAVHRVAPERVIRDFRQAGFELVARERFFENPEDEPTVNVFDEAVRGRTDRFAMRFAKAGDPNVAKPAVDDDEDTALQEEDQCGAGAVQSYVGERPDDGLRTRLAEESGAAMIRAYDQGSPVTMDFRPDRLNVVTDPISGLIIRLRCG